MPGWRYFADKPLAGHPVLGGVPRGLRLKMWWRVSLHRRCGFAYIRIPKAANSTVSKTLALYAWPGRARWMRQRDAIWAKRQYQHFGPRTTVESLLERFFCFSFFRNPYSRTLSAFLQKLEKPKYRWAKRAAGVDRLDGRGFERFVDWLEHGGLHADVHWAPQTLICPVPVARLHFSGRVENLDRDLAALMRRLFPESDYQRPETRQRDRQHAIRRLQEFYTPALAARVHELFIEDFRQLGYPEDLAAGNEASSTFVVGERIDA